MRWSPAHTYNFSFPVNPKASTINVTFNLNAQAHYKYVDPLDFRGAKNNLITLYNNGTAIWSGAFDAYIDNEGAISQTISTGKLNVSSVSTVTGTFWSRPYFCHTADGRDAFDVKFDVVSISGVLDTGDATNYIDKEGQALFLAVDGNSNNFTVS